jgi:hypothetical protein
MSFVPRPILRSAGIHVYRRGQTPQSIAGMYGQPASSYRDLVAANHRKPMTMRGVGAGASATFASLSDGEQLRLPWFWFAGKNEGNRRMLASGSVGDVQQDAIAAFLTDMFVKVVKDPALLPHIPMAVNTIALWWRQDHPGGELPTAADVAVYSIASTSWYNKIGKMLPVEVASSIPWNEVPFRALAIFQAASGITPSAINWGIINDYLEKNVTPGMFPVQYTPIDYKQPIDFGGNVPGTNGKWGNVPWNVLSQVRWDLLPLSYLDTSGAPAGVGEQTAWLLGKIKSAVAAKTPAQSGASSDVAPLPSLTPPDCSKVGKGAYPSRTRLASSPAHAAAGPNAHAAPDGGWHATTASGSTRPQPAPDPRGELPGRDALQAGLWLRHRLARQAGRGGRGKDQRNDDEPAHCGRRHLGRHGPVLRQPEVNARGPYRPESRKTRR